MHYTDSTLVNFLWKCCKIRLESDKSSLENSRTLWAWSNVGYGAPEQAGPSRPLPSNRTCVHGRAAEVMSTPVCRRRAGACACRERATAKCWGRRRACWAVSWPPSPSTSACCAPACVAVRCRRSPPPATRRLVQDRTASPWTAHTRTATEKTFLTFKKLLLPA